MDGLLIGSGTLPPTDDPPDSLSRALDSNLKFTVSSDDDGHWYSTSYVYYYDSDALESIEVSNGEYTSLQTIVEVDVNEQETISFYWKVSSQENHDYLQFYIDYELQDQISGEVDWEKKTYDINEPGPHILKWRYKKDADDKDGEDCGWVDFVKWTGASPLPPPEDWDTITYKYDASGRRVEKAFDNDYRVKYIYDGDNVIAEYDGVNNLLRKYVHGAGVDEPVCMIDVADSNEIYYYHFDGLGSVVALSDSEGDTVQTYEYSAFGKVAVSDPNFTANPYMFTGRRFDIETGLYYYRARYYNPHIGRFMQTDPVGYEDGINWYTYCGNNPLNSIDPSGTQHVSSIGNVGSVGEILAFYGPSEAISLYGRSVVIDWACANIGANIIVAQQTIEIARTLFPADPCNRSGPSSPMWRILNDNDPNTFRRWLKHSCPISRPYDSEEILRIINKIQECGLGSGGRADPPHGKHDYHYHPEYDWNKYIPITPAAYELLKKLGY